MTGAGAGPLPSAPKRDSGSEPAGPTLIESTTTLATMAPAGDPPDDETSEGSIALVDPSTGLESPTAWRRAVDDEVVRLARYHRPATVMLIELDGFERLTERLGEPAGARLVLATARTLHAQARAADRCARFGRARFAILMPETDEIEAINFGERVRSECDRWLEAGEVAMRLALGWATLDPDQGSGPAILAAEHRLDAERRQRSGSAA
jgi:diguanylate cyclase (GGDEF)-like protein